MKTLSSDRAVATTLCVFVVASLTFVWGLCLCERTSKMLSGSVSRLAERNLVVVGPEKGFVFPLLSWIDTHVHSIPSLPLAPVFVRWWWVGPGKSQPLLLARCLEEFSKQPVKGMGPSSSSHLMRGGRQHVQPYISLHNSLPRHNPGFSHR